MHTRLFSIPPRTLWLTLWAITALVRTAAAGEPTPDYDRYYAVIMGNARSGWMHATQVTKDGQITTTRDVHFNFRRGESTTKAGMTTTFVENASGKPVMMRSSQLLGETPVIVEYHFREKDVEVVNDPDGERKITREALPPGAWLTPRGAAELLARRVQGGAREVSYETLDPLSGLEVVTVKHTSIRKLTRIIAGKPRDGIAMVTRASNASGAVSEDFVDERGALIQQISSMSGLECVFEIAGPEVVGSTGRAPEMLVSTFVKPDRRIREPRKTIRATYTLSFGEHEAPQLPETGSQTLAAMGVHQLDVVIDTSFPNAAAPEDRKDARFTESSAMITSNDERVRALAERAVQGLDAADTLGRAHALTAMVHRHVTGKNLDVLFATAADVARTRSGDCTEHAVLLAAMLRAQGIPSRVVSGLIYAETLIGSDDIFGYHMWTQALIEVDGKDRWVDLDATLEDEPMYDATHIALDVLTLAEGPGGESRPGLAAAMGRVQIKVRSVERR
ncbi:MAG TPA: transglutaminase-like domain-containing protein [Phycisphaerales bacterium]|nr:transglutaminase-like domain-containing protein [Phycisphaerales bacterium]